jgi:hypothetical protein
MTLVDVCDELERANTRLAAFTRYAHDSQGGEFHYNARFELRLSRRVLLALGQALIDGWAQAPGDTARFYALARQAEAQDQLAREQEEPPPLPASPPGTPR